jgi:TonB family protein
MAVARQGSRHQRLLVLLLVGFLHLGLVTLLVLGLILRASQAPERALQVTLGGPLGAPVRLPPAAPSFIDPDSPQITIPSVDLATDQPNALSGSPDVTRPAEAIADEHEFPTYPGSGRPTRPAEVRLLLSISEDGAIGDAQIAGTSGSPILDALAVAWVKQHWRYRPALRDGTPLAVTTAAIVVFL